MGNVTYSEFASGHIHKRIQNTPDYWCTLIKLNVKIVIYTCQETHLLHILILSSFKVNLKHENVS